MILLSLFSFLLMLPPATRLLFSLCTSVMKEEIIAFDGGVFSLVPLENLKLT